jgi:hypothetical protein
MVALQESRINALEKELKEGGGADAKVVQQQEEKIKSLVGILNGCFLSRPYLFHQTYCPV